MTTAVRPMRGLWLAAFAVFALLVGAPPAEAEMRLALVVGNDLYKNVPWLSKAVTDLNAIASRCAS